MSKLLKVVRVHRYDKDNQLTGGYIQSVNDASVISDELKTAEIGEKWVIVLTEMTKKSYEKLADFPGY